MGISLLEVLIVVKIHTAGIPCKFGLEIKDQSGIVMWLELNRLDMMRNISEPLFSVMIFLN